MTAAVTGSVPPGPKVIKGGRGGPKARTLAIKSLEETSERFLIRNGVDLEARLSAPSVEQLRVRAKALGLERSGPVRIATFEV